MRQLIEEGFKPQVGDLIEVVHGPKAYHYMILEVLAEQSPWRFVIHMYLIKENEALKATLNTKTAHEKNNIFLVSRVGENNGQ